ncbi:hypothetical protein QAD02_006628 [Eretmocerus hayati]|uniref:Uncharacterized protein n=1 Tax=Eretmocerus hayati TaxID=131215 RepID=A0ACC2N275_9HYME|nr:hypothetical protein QAD02_006628 [Eretmocerus hayati]
MIRNWWKKVNEGTIMLQAVIPVVLFNIMQGIATSESCEYIDLETRIKNGEEVESIRDYPFMVGILDQGRYRCCGTIISRSAILTAAHCTDKVLAKDLTVRVGSLKKDSGGEVYTVTQFIRPSEYFPNGHWTKYDIALLQLETALPTDGIAKPVDLIQPTELIPERAKARAIGWGLTWNKEIDEMGTLRYVDFPLLPKGICSFDAYDAPEDMTGQICAGEQGKSACAGDSGGPLLVENRQIGIASRSRCSSNSRPTTYTDIRYFYDWIRLTLWGLTREMVGTVTPEQNGNVAIGTRIKNGEEVRSIKDYPFMVGILDKGRYRCCGTIISRSAILTAAHCTDNVQPTELTVRVGSVTRDYGGKLYSVDRFVRPPNYSRNMYVAEYDIAILKLKTALPTGGIVKPVNLIQSNERIPERSMGTAIGWGLTWNKEYDQKGWLRYVDFPLLTKGICSFDESKAPQNLTGQICAGDVGRSACAGDSGGPLMVGNRQVGIAIKSQCYSNARPTRYVDVSYVHDWISRNLWNLARETIGEWNVKSEVHFPK